jgi:hypothetical protein
MPQAICNKIQLVIFWKETLQNAFIRVELLHVDRQMEVRNTTGNSVYI